MVRSPNKRFRLAIAFPCVHFVLWLGSLLGSRAAAREQLKEVGNVIGRVLAVTDFPVSVAAIVLAWVLPEIWLIVGFGLLGTLWWYYLGRRGDAWVTRRMME